MKVWLWCLGDRLVDRGHYYTLVFGKNSWTRLIEFFRSHVGQLQSLLVVNSSTEHECEKPSQASIPIYYTCRIMKSVNPTSGLNPHMHTLKMPIPFPILQNHP